MADPKNELLIQKWMADPKMDGSSKKRLLFQKWIVIPKMVC